MDIEVAGFMDLKDEYTQREKTDSETDECIDSEWMDRDINTRREIYW